MALISAISWSVLPLVAGLFVLVEMLAETGVIAQLSQLLARATLDSQLAAATTSGLAIALGSNAITIGRPGWSPARPHCRRTARSG
jgi:arsenical pump membrane protein